MIIGIRVDFIVNLPELSEIVRENERLCGNVAMNINKKLYMKEGVPKYGENDRKSK